MPSPKKIRKKKSPKPKKVVIDYPEVPTRTWIPPDKRKKVITKPPQTKYHKPEGIDQKLAISSLKKMWCYFEVLGDRAILPGSISQNSKRFPTKTRGFQAPANVVMAISFSQLYEMPRWKSHYIDNILILGDQLYMDSRRHLKDPRKEIISLLQVYKTFYVGTEKITVDIKKEGGFKGSATLATLDIFGRVVKDFFNTEYSCVLIYQEKYYAIWKQARGYYIFDPYECCKEGTPWTGLPHMGVACLTKCISLGAIVNHVISCSLNNSPSVIKAEYSLTPVYIQRVVHVNTKYPDCLEDANLEVKPPPDKDIIQSDGTRRKPESATIASEKVDEDDESEEEPQPAEVPPEEADTVYTDYGSRVDQEPKVEKVKEKKLPLLQKPEELEVSYYLPIVPGKMSILRAPAHQCNPNFSKYLGKQSFANAFSAIAMLHIYKSKLWTTKTMEDILKAAEQIHHDSLKTLTGDNNMKVTDVCRKVTCCGLDFTPKVEEYSAVGKLNSDKDDVSDLTRALKEVLSDNDAVIITGPLIVAFWCQGDEYYMWDPNERNEKGMDIAKEEKIGSFTKSCNNVPGFGCVTRYKYLLHMVQVYMLNVPRANRRDPFILSKVEMEDYMDEIPDWFNFKSLKVDKWILCGSFNQSDVRFPSNLRNTQCTSMAAMFLAYAHLTDVKEWTAEQVDEILVSGNDYYGLCIRSLKETGKFSNRLLMASELLPQFVIGNKKMILNLEELIVYGTLSKFKNAGFGVPFKQGLKQFFEENDYGILTSSNLSVAIFHIENGYFVADSHSRNDCGYVTHFGTAVVIRYLHTEDMATSLEANYHGSSDPTYNIHRVSYEIWDANDDGVLKPPLNNYTAISDHVAILRGPTSENCPTRFPLTFGRQQVPMGLAVLGMIKLTSAPLWTINLLDEVLNVGNKYYKRCIEQYYKEHEKPSNDDDDEEAPSETTGGFQVFGDDPAEDPDGLASEPEVEVEEAESDAITSENVLKDFLIGINKFTLDLEKSQDGVIVDLPFAIQSIFQVPEVDENDTRELLVETNPLNVVLWHDNGLYYYFDPKPRDAEGHAYGKDEWTLIPPEELALLSEIGKNPEELYDGVEQGEGEDQHDADVEKEQKVSEPTDDAPQPADGPEEVNVEAPQSETDVEAEGDNNRNPIEEEIEVPPKHSASYWKRQEIDGMACVMWFTELEDLVNHVIENIPPRMRNQRFRLTQVKMQNEVLEKDVYDPESGPKENRHDGNWHNFKEVTHGHWILRGTTNCRETVFPMGNRGRQYIGISFAAAAFAHLYAFAKFVNGTVNTILKYGDKLHTSTRRVHKAALEGKQQEDKKVCAMTKDEVEAILNLESMTINDMVKKFCIGEHCVTVAVVENLLQGELFQENPEILTLENALYGFFGSAGVYAVLQTKGVHLFITMHNGAYFVFDPDCRGPSGRKSTSGDACISRYLNLKVMCEVIVSNLTLEGSNAFFIHGLHITVEPCERSVQIEEISPTAPIKISGFNTLVPGKRIICGSISIESEKYKKLEKQQSAPVNMVALAMTLIHRSDNWTKAIIDEVIRIGSELYQDVMDANSENFNPWEQKMTLYLAPTDFKIGSIKVNCELRNNDQRGIVDIKSSKLQNLRRGLELFFIENTHGIISTYDLMVAVWKPEGQTRIYMFDGSSRGSNGMPSADCGACVLVFDTPKLAVDHFIALTPEFGRRGAYVVVPVEIVVAKAGTKKHTKRAMASKQEKELLERQRRKELEALNLKGRHEFYEIQPKMAILHGDRSQNSKYYSANSRGNQDLTNCVMAYVMEKMKPITKWNYTIINNILDIGDQLYKDSVVVFNPTNPKLGVEALQRSVVIASCTVKLAVGKPIMANNFNAENVVKSLEVFFGSRQFCILNVGEHWLGLFKKSAQYYMFDPQDIDVHGNRIEQIGGGFAAVTRFDELELLVEHMVQNLRCNYAVFYLIVIAVKDVLKTGK